MIDEPAILNKNLSLIVVDEHHTVKTCQHTHTFNLTFILQIWQKSEASLCLAFLPLFLPGFFVIELDMHIYEYSHAVTEVILSVYLH